MHAIETAIHVIDADEFTDRSNRRSKAGETLLFRDHPEQVNPRLFPTLSLLQ
jgi:hypothetical protein